MHSSEDAVSEWKWAIFFMNVVFKMKLEKAKRNEKLFKSVFYNIFRDLTLAFRMWESESKALIR